MAGSSNVETICFFGGCGVGFWGGVVGVRRCAPLSFSAPPLPTKNPDQTSRKNRSLSHLPAQHQRQALHPVKVGVLDAHTPCLLEQLLRVVVDELPVDEDVAPVLEDVFAFLFHLVAFGRLDLRHLGHGVDAHARAVDLDLVRVHGGVGDQDLGIIHAAGLAHAEALVEDETLVEERVLF